MNTHTNRLMVRTAALGVLTATVTIVAAGATQGTTAGQQVQRSPVRATEAKMPPMTVAIAPTTADPGDPLTLSVTESIRARRTLKVSDSNGLAWAKTSDNGTTATFSVAAVGTSSGQVTITMKRLSDGAVTTAKATYAVNQPRFPGHQPGKVVVGMSCGTLCPEHEALLGHAYGVHRKFFAWGDWTRMGTAIEADHLAGRLPWVSFKPPGYGAAGWRAVANGSYDSGLAGLASMLKAHDDAPVLITFNHEPSNDGTEQEGTLWASAYGHIHDVLKAAGALENVADPPILGDWLWNPRNDDQNPANWVTPGVLQRAPFLGIDLYENNEGSTFAQRIPVIRTWLAAQGFPDLMVGIGETGGTDASFAKLSAVDWINQSLGWAVAHPDQVAVVSYFNSTANSKDTVYWPLDESPPKVATFRSWLDHPRVADDLG